MLLRFKQNSGFNPGLVIFLICLAGKLLAATETNSWSLASPNGQCAISVSMSAGGDLSYQVSRAGKTVIQNSPLGLRRDDQNFEHSLALVRAGKVKKRHEKYELFTELQSHVDHYV